MDIFDAIPGICGALPTWVHIALWVGFAISHVVHYYLNLRASDQTGASANEIATKNKSLSDTDLDSKLSSNLPK